MPSNTQSSGGGNFLTASDLISNTTNPLSGKRFIHVVGGQYGSEGKGRVVGAILEDRKFAPHVCVRIGGPQAGHTVYVDKQKLVFKQLPIGAAFGKISVIGRSAIVDPRLLAKEMSMNTGPVIVDPNAIYLEDSAADQEAQLRMFESIGSTMTGVGATRAAHIMRTATLVGQDPSRLPPGVTIGDTYELVTNALDRGQRVLIEGTQGIGLGLIESGHYPYATSADLSPAATLTAMGFSIADMRKHALYVLGVFRTFPIRVAGESGPLHREVDWDYMRRVYGEHIPVEKTTVTKRVRRVGYWDAELAKRSVKVGEIDGAFYTFLDYIHPRPAIPVYRAWVQARELELDIPTVGISDGSGSEGEPVLWTS